MNWGSLRMPSVVVRRCFVCVSGFRAYQQRSQRRARTTSGARPRIMAGALRPVKNSTGYVRMTVRTNLLHVLSDDPASQRMSIITPVALQDIFSRLHSFQSHTMTTTIAFFIRCLYYCTTTFKPTYSNKTTHNSSIVITVVHVDALLLE